MQPRDGGPAFPGGSEGKGCFERIAPGMSLRDWFAGQALVGLLSCGTSLELGPDEGNDNNRLSAVVYSVADALLAAREVRS